METITNGAAFLEEKLDKNVAIKRKSWEVSTGDNDKFLIYSGLDSPESSSDSESDQDAISLGKGIIEVEY